MRLIDADALHYWTAEYCPTGLWLSRFDIMSAPTIKAGKEVAQWIENGYGDGELVCSNCGEPCATFSNMKPRDRFCKWCGAKMEGGSKYG